MSARRRARGGRRRPRRGARACIGAAAGRGRRRCWPTTRTRRTRGGRRAWSPTGRRGWPPSWPATASSCWWWRRCRRARTRSSRSRRRPACPRWRSTRRWCRPRPAAASRRIAAIWADGTLRAQPWLKAHRFQRGGVEVVPLPWPGWRRRSRPAARPTRRRCPTCRADCTVALLCPYAAMTAERVRRPGQLRDDHRRARPPPADADGRARPPPPRPGRLMLRSSHPVRAQASLPARPAPR